VERRRGNDGQSESQARKQDVHNISNAPKPLTGTSLRESANHEKQDKKSTQQCHQLNTNDRHEQSTGGNKSTVEKGIKGFLEQDAFSAAHFSSADPKRILNDGGVAHDK
jgi:hypothetical protein